MRGSRGCASSSSAGSSSITSTCRCMSWMLRLGLGCCCGAAISASTASSCSSVSRSGSATARARRAAPQASGISCCGARDFVLQLLLVHGWETTDRFSWNYPSWALSVEWAGYLAFPLVLAALLKAPRWAVPLVPVAGLLGLVSMTLFGPMDSLNYTLSFGLVRFGFEFAIGLGLGRLATEGRLSGPLPWLALVGLPAGLWLGQDALTVLGLAGVMVVTWRAGL